MENEKETFIDKIGGRKFVLALLSLLGIIVIAVVKPEALTTESVIGILGVVAAYSGSNSFITAFATRGKSQPEETVQPQAQAPIQTPAVDPQLEARVSQLENTQTQMIEVIKQQGVILTALRSSSIRGNQDVG